MTSARRVAVAVSEQIRADEAYSNLALPPAIRKAKLDPRDAALATDLVYGSHRLQGQLDVIIWYSTSKSISQIDGRVLDILRLGVYELLIRHAPSHVVNEWVEIAKKVTPRASGFINANLRAVSRKTLDEWLDIVTPELDDDDAEMARTAHPSWILDAYRQVRGSDIDALIDANNEPPVPTLIALPGLARRPADAYPTLYSPYGFRNPLGSPSHYTASSQGTIRVQDEGSQIAALLLTGCSEVVPGEEWLDLCAGPGGKTAILGAVALQTGARVMANEITPHRADLVVDAVTASSSAVMVVSEDGRTLRAHHQDEFSRVLADVPCTGLGALRRRAESRWRKLPRLLDELVPLQRELLAAAIDMTAPGGVIAYVTCSPHVAETTEIIEFVCGQRTDIEIIDTPAVARRVFPNLDNAERGTAVQLWPDLHETDAMFIQLIRRTQ
jgi:16S rRNA (cytosine967-C5)-methyltransferase